MSVVVEPDHPRPKTTRYQHIQRDPAITACADDGDPDRRVQVDLLDLYLRFRDASGGLRLRYLALLLAYSWGPMPGILAFTQGDRPYPYMLHRPMIAPLLVVPI